MFYMRLSATIPTVSTHKQQLFWILVMQFLCIFTGEFNHLQRFNRFRLVVSLIMNHPRGHQQLGKMHQRWFYIVGGKHTRLHLEVIPLDLFVATVSFCASALIKAINSYILKHELSIRPISSSFFLPLNLTHYTTTFITQIFVFKKKMFILMPRKKGSHTAIDIYCLFYFIF